MRLTPKQREVLTLMADGWELLTCDGQAVLSKPEQRVKRVGISTFRALKHRELISVGKLIDYLTTTYTLTPEGRKAIDDD